MDCICTCTLYSIHVTVKKVSRNVINHTLSGREYLNYSRPGRVWWVTSRLGTGKSLTFFFKVYVYIYKCTQNCLRSVLNGTVRVRIGLCPLRIYIERSHKKRKYFFDSPRRLKTKTYAPFSVWNYFCHFKSDGPFKLTWETLTIVYKVEAVPLIHFFHPLFSCRTTPLKKKTVPNELVILECPPSPPCLHGAREFQNQTQRQIRQQYWGSVVPPPSGGRRSVRRPWGGWQLRQTQTNTFLCYTIFSDSKVVFDIN